VIEVNLRGLFEEAELISEQPRTVAEAAWARRRSLAIV
jgi:hypothetical protein